MTRLLAHFDSMKHAFEAEANDLKQAGIPLKTALGFVHARDEISPAQIHQRTIDLGFSAITINDETYPALLRQIYDPPAILYIEGKLPSNEVAHLAIVGSRKASPYGLSVVSELSRQIAESGVVVVSGLAFGIDEAAHMATVKAGGTTVAVLAHGLLMHTSRGRYVTDKIVESGGAIISEFPLSAPALKQNFPYRNRVISGMSHGTLIIEATEKSGSLITARAALDQNREVFAVPGPINSLTSVGTNNLIKMGAHPTTGVADILDILEVSHVQEKAIPKPKPDSKEEAAILDLLSKTPIHIDELIRETQLNSQKIASTLSLMEMKGRARQIGGMYYILV